MRLIDKIKLYNDYKGMGFDQNIKAIDITQACNLFYEDMITFSQSVCQNINGKEFPFFKQIWLEYSLPECINRFLNVEKVGVLSSIKKVEDISDSLKTFKNSSQDISNNMELSNFEKSPYQLELKVYIETYYGIEHISDVFSNVSINKDVVKIDKLNITVRGYDTEFNRIYGKDIDTVKFLMTNFFVKPTLFSLSLFNKRGVDKKVVKGHTELKIDRKILDIDGENKPNLFIVR